MEEAAAIKEYAKCCGESLPELIRKALIREATLADGFGADDLQYDYRLKLPVDVDTTSFSDTRERKLVEDNYNHIRSILGWRKIRF